MRGQGCSAGPNTVAGLTSRPFSPILLSWLRWWVVVVEVDGGGVWAWSKHVYLVTGSDGFIITTGFFSNIFTAVAGPRDCWQINFMFSCLVGVSTPGQSPSSSPPWGLVAVLASLSQSDWVIRWHRECWDNKLRRALSDGWSSKWSSQSQSVGVLYCTSYLLHLCPLSVCLLDELRPCDGRTTRAGCSPVIKT